MLEKPAYPAFLFFTKDYYKKYINGNDLYSGLNDFYMLQAVDLQRIIWLFRIKY